MNTTSTQSQLKIVYNYLQHHTATATMVSNATKVPQKSICRFKRSLEKQGLLYEVERKLCKITKFPAYYLTTNKALFPKLQPKNYRNGKS